AGQRHLRPAGGAGLVGTPGTSAMRDAPGIIGAVQREVFPLEINYFRSEPVLRESLQRLHGLWPLVQGGIPGGDARERVRAREAAAMVAAARWIHTAGLARRETRGMHTLAEYPHTDPAYQRRLLVSGLDDIRVKFEGGGEVPPLTAAAPTAHSGPPGQRAHEPLRPSGGEAVRKEVTPA
ncbi:pyridine nucleotide-disulfide oxidoreductase, partial [Paenibacillus chitinolyticus]|nr:pyridine nucleotide-disulfide oxidoreductase [Paenibacillus chitinolyticus]